MESKLFVAFIGCILHRYNVVGELERYPVSKLPASKTGTCHSEDMFLRILVGVLTKCLEFDEENLRTYTRPLACGTLTKLASGGNKMRS